LISSLGAMLRISLRRSRADWPIVFAAGLICLLAATLLAAGAIYANAVSIAGLHRVLADAPVQSANISVSTRVPIADVDAVDAIVEDELGRVFGPVGGEIVVSARSDSFALPGQPTGEIRVLTVLGFAEGLSDHAALVDGAWPDGTTTPEGDLPVAVSERVATALGLEAGQRLPLRSQLDDGLVVPVRVVAVFRIDDPTDPFWWDETLALEGVVSSERFDTHGPFFTTQRDLLDRAAGSRIQVTWHGRPGVAGVRVSGIEDLRTRTGQLPGRLREVLATTVTVETELPQILQEAERSLLVSRTGVLLLTVQLVVLAAYAVLLSAALLIEHRRVDTAMLRSRGAGTWRLVALSAIEGVLLTVPAALIGPWLGAAALHAFNLGGPLAEIGLTISPEVSSDAYLAAGAAALVCFLALILPAFRTARSFASTHGKLARAETAGIGQRLGLDIALLAIAGVGLWQLRHYGAPLTRSVQGTLGLDPLLVATPAIGLLAGAIVALRIIPLLAQVIERATVRTQGLVPSLGARQLSRRPLRYTRSALLLMLAMALGVFAVSYTWTWSASQRDQATHAIGADVRIQPGGQQGAMPRWALDRALADVPGVVERVPVDREAVRLTGTSGGGQIVALDATVAGTVVDVRSDLTTQPLTELLAPLAAARPIVEAVPLPGEPTQLRLDVDLKIRLLERPEFDTELEVLVNEPAELSEIAGWRGLAATVVIRDQRGTLHRFGGGDVATVDGGPHQLIVPLGTATDGVAVSFDYPLDLMAIELAVRLPEGYQTPDATVTLGDLEAAGADGAWQPVALELETGWRSTAAFYGRPHQAVADGLRGPALEAVTGEPGLRVLSGIDRSGRGAILTFAPSSIGHVADDPIPVVATAPFLEATASQVGDEVGLVVDGVRRVVVVSAVMQAFPTTSPDDAIVVMDLATIALLRFEGNDAVEAPEEWWLSVDEGATANVTAALSRAPIGSRVVLSQEERNRTLSTDPVALGIIGALAIGFVAAALFAVVGFMVSAAVSARERITEFALLRALGLSANQLSVWLSLENAVLAAVSLVTGTVLGLVIAWVVLPFITVTQGATTPFPPVEVDVPWTTIATLEVIGIVALAITVGFLAWLLRRIGLASVLRMSED
jgi:hypothetical protein